MHSLWQYLSLLGTWAICNSPPKWCLNVCLMYDHHPCDQYISLTTEELTCFSTFKSTCIVLCTCKEACQSPFRKINDVIRYGGGGLSPWCFTTDYHQMIIHSCGLSLCHISDSCVKHYVVYTTLWRYTLGGLSRCFTTIIRFYLW